MKPYTETMANLPDWQLEWAQNYLVIKTPLDKPNAKGKRAPGTVAYLPRKNPRVGEALTLHHAAVLAGVPSILRALAAIGDETCDNPAYTAQTALDIIETKLVELVKNSRTLKK
jgi:hypothetical protein